ncbi:MAG: hypothetical protein AAB664_00600 [Patescibacteria group bacterium]
MEKNTLTNEQRFERVDHQFGVMDRRSERMEFRTNQRFDVIEVRLDRHDNQFLELKNTVTDFAIMTKNEFDRVNDRFDVVNERFDNMENIMKPGFDRLDKLESLMKQGFGIA